MNEIEVRGGYRPMRGAERSAHAVLPFPKTVPEEKCVDLIDLLRAAAVTSALKVYWFFVLKVRSEETVMLPAASLLITR